MRPRLPDAPVSVDDTLKQEGIVFLGLLDYRQVHGLQLRLVDRRREGSLAQDLFLVTEHPRVYTLGRRGGRHHLMVSDEFLRKEGIAVLPIERGGEITYHGPGQLVVYPILDLRQREFGLEKYVALLEEVMLEIARVHGVDAGRDSRNHGVWVGNSKLGSIGIAVRHGVAFHGMAINVNIDLTPFSWVNPCGLADVQMTSLSQAADREVTMEEVQKNLIPILQKVFDRRFAEIPRADIFQEE